MRMIRTGRVARGLVGGGAGLALALAAAAPSTAAPAKPAWSGFGGDAQHSGVAPATPQPLTHVHWQVSVDHHPDIVGGDDDGPIAHYASPMITSHNTVIVPTRLGEHRGFDLDAYAGPDGTRLWRMHTDYTAPPEARIWWPPPIPAALRDDNHVAVAAAGGTLLLRRHVNRADGGVRRIAFYGTAAWRAHRTAYRDSVHITTPITTGPDGSLYFAFSATATAPGHLRNGVARVAPDGSGSWVSARTLAGTRSGAHVVLNCAPGLSADGTTAYVALVSHHRTRPVLVGFDTSTLKPLYRHGLKDPQTHNPAALFENSTAAPTIGPDGDVYLGVLGNPLLKHDERGWLLHFDAHLTTVKTPGSFGWDDTVSVVPAASVPSYAGTSPYLLVSKYNNYGQGPHGDGRNRIALLDPDASQKDRYSRVRVMREVSTVLSPRHPPHTAKGERYEWCINSVAVDPATGTAIANNEDGHLYLWDLDTGTLTESIKLNKPRGQAYTMTVIGPDGTSYAIENATLYAVGS
ncbi:MAG: hypothetical protein QM747_05770 [Nocardioides sp.]